METTDMTQNNGYNNFSAYFTNVDVIKQLRYTNKTGNLLMYVKFRRVRVTVVALEKQTYFTPPNYFALFDYLKGKYFE